LIIDHCALTITCPGEVWLLTKEWGMNNGQWSILMGRNKKPREQSLLLLAGLGF